MPKFSHITLASLDLAPKYRNVWLWSTSGDESHRDSAGGVLLTVLVPHLDGLRFLGWSECTTQGTHHSTTCSEQLELTSD